MSAQGETADLFDEGAEATAGYETLAEGALLLRHFIGDEDAALMASLHTIITQAPLRQMLTRGGFRMSVAMSNCGDTGWISDRRGYRYDAIDPQTGRPWPAMPAAFTALAARAAAARLRPASRIRPWLRPLRRTSRRSRRVRSWARSEV